MSVLALERALQRCKPPEHVPVLPKIWLDTAAALSGQDLPPLMEDGCRAMRAIVDVCAALGFDGARLFPFPDRRVRMIDGRPCEVDQHGAVLGEVDLAGGLGIPPRPADTMDWTDPATLHALNWRPVRIADDASFDFESIAVPDAHWYEQRYGKAVRDLLGRHGGRMACIGDLDSPTLSFYTRFRGTEATLMDLLDHAAQVQAAVELGVRWCLERGRFFLDAGCRVLRLNDSMANMSLIAPETWRQFIKPAFTRICAELHRYRPDALIYCHICGNTMGVLRDLMETGLDGIGPLDTLAGTNIAEARRIVGDTPLVGGVNPINLFRGPVEAVTRECRTVMEQARATEGHFVLGSGCAVSPLTPVEHLLALRDAAHATPCGPRRIVTPPASASPPPRLDLQGIITVLNTPFDQHNQVNLGALRQNVESAIGTGVVGFLVPALASEVHKLSAAERYAMVGAVVEQSAGRVAVIGGASADDARQRLDHVRRLKDLGCDGVLVALNSKDGPDVCRRTLDDIARLQPPWLMIQDWDAAGFGLPVDLIVKLFEEFPCFRSLKVEVVPAGIKYSQVRQATGGRLHLAGGWAVSQMIEGLDRGVDAFMPTAMHEIYCRINRLYRAGDRAGAVALFRRVLPVLAFANQHLDISIHFFKRLLWRQGLYPTPAVRQPILPFDDVHEAAADELTVLVMDLISELKRQAGPGDGASV